MRILVWFAVALIAVVVLQLRPDEPRRDDRSHRPMNGRTSQGEAVWAIVRDGKVQVVELGWRFRCTNGGSDRTASRFEVGRESFRWNGRRFSATDASPRPPSDDGWDGLFEANVEGQLSRDGDRASGSAGATVIWFDTVNRSRVTCESGPVRWSVKR